MVISTDFYFPHSLQIRFAPPHPVHLFIYLFIQSIMDMNLGLFILVFRL